MYNKYDKIFKENLEEIFLPLAKRLLGIESDRMIEIPDDLQVTKELFPDFLKKVLHDINEKDFILHLEFQSADDYGMAKRMLNYYSMLFDRYDLPVMQQVFYLGRGKSKMRNNLSHNNLNFNFEIISFNSIPYQEFIDSEIPEEMILAILADFTDEKPEKIITKLLEKIDNLNKGTFCKQRIVNQLEVISGLRNLQPIIVELIPKIMALDYDIRKDLRYQQGMQKGLEEGLEKGLEEKDKMILALLKKGKLNHEEIAEAGEVSLDYIKKIAELINK
jgi:predicted transposase/invertase (TIGR01784 family)